MKSIKLPSGGVYYAHEYNALRADAKAAGLLLVHQQLGALALGTNPSNNQTVTLDINGTNVVFTAVTTIGSTAGNFLIGASAAATVANLYNLLINPTVTTSTGVALSAANATLVQYLGYGLPTGGTTITPYSLNTSTYGPLTSFSASTTVTSGSWTGQTMQLYVEPGTYYVGATRVLYLGGSTPTVTAPVSHPRIDIVTADSSGTIALVTGTENASPVAPSYPANKLVLVEIYNVVGETALYDNDNQQTGQGYVSNDVRPAMAPPYISSASQVASGLFLLDPGGEAQGAIPFQGAAALQFLVPGTAGYVLQTQGGSANPQWALETVTHTIADFSQPTLTNNADNTFQTIASYSVPGLTNGQTLWLRILVNCTTSSGSPNNTLRIQMNGTTILTLAQNSVNTSIPYYLDVMIGIPTAASSQNYSGLANVPNTGALVLLNGTAAANLASAFTLTVQGETTVHTDTVAWTIQNFTLFTFN
jgi:hypothetical protein